MDLCNRYLYVVRLFVLAHLTYLMASTAREKGFGAQLRNTYKTLYFEKDYKINTAGTIDDKT